LVANGELRHIGREFRTADVDGHWLVIIATNDASVQSTVRKSADDARIFCNSVDDVDNSSYITPAIVDRGPVVVAISSAGAAPVLARRIRAQLESLLPTSIGLLATVAREWRWEVSKMIHDTFGRRRFWERVFDGSVASAIQSGGSEAGHEEIARLLQQEREPGKRQGEAWLVGAGPGDPELLTLRALQAMQSADVIMHDRLVSGEVLELARRDADKIDVGKIPGCQQNSQEAINELMVSLVAAGNRVCRLKGGDPFIFGRGGEEIEALNAAGLPCQVVPGITAAAGCAAYSGIPLTHRDASQAVVLLTAHGKNSVDRLDWRSLARERQTLAVYMAVRRFPGLMRKLIAHGRSADTPVAIIERGTTPEQRVIRGSLGQLTMLAEAHQIAAPAMLIIGEVAKFGQERSSHTKDGIKTLKGGKNDLRQYSANNR
jgi:uroporphyrin-III C-methyltransferase/precorrin-2 dehydrogenase/sirohydrochlorin ferrochelatase